MTKFSHSKKHLRLRSCFLPGSELEPKVKRQLVLSQRSVERKPARRYDDVTAHERVPFARAMIGALGTESHRSSSPKAGPA
ncbi:unnamed protein product, partial [Nesidiocoris tenuis]